MMALVAVMLMRHQQMTRRRRWGYGYYPPPPETDHRMEEMAEKARQEEGACHCMNHLNAREW